METKDDVSEVVSEVAGTTTEELEATIKRHFEKIRTQSMKLGATYIAAAVSGVVQKHIGKPSPSLRDYKRMTEEIRKIVSVQLKQSETPQNDLNEAKEEDS